MVGAEAVPVLTAALTDEKARRGRSCTGTTRPGRQVGSARPDGSLE